MAQLIDMIKTKGALSVFISEIVLVDSCYYAQYGVKPLNGLELMINYVKEKANEDVIKAVGKLGDRKAEDFLISLLDSDDKSIWIEAIKALGDIGARDAIPHILKKWRKDRSANNEINKTLKSLLYVK